MITSNEIFIAGVDYDLYITYNILYCTHMYIFSVPVYILFQCVRNNIVEKQFHTHNMYTYIIF